jgi:hypothetical protein
MRARISPAAFRVKVTARIADGRGVRPARSSSKHHASTRFASVHVFPDPAFATRIERFGGCAAEAVDDRVGVLHTSTAKEWYEKLGWKTLYREWASLEVVNGEEKGERIDELCSKKMLRDMQELYQGFIKDCGFSGCVSRMFNSPQELEEYWRNWVLKRPSAVINKEDDPRRIVHVYQDKKMIGYLMLNPNAKAQHKVILELAVSCTLEKDVQTSVICQMLEGTGLKQIYVPRPVYDLFLSKKYPCCEIFVDDGTMYLPGKTGIDFKNWKNHLFWSSDSF